MSKKRFKGGLDSLLQHTLHQEDNPLAKTVSIGLKSRPKQEDIEEKKTKEKVVSLAKEEAPEHQQKDIEKTKQAEAQEQLKWQIELLKQELFLWRTGKLNPEKFNKSLKDKGLKFNAENNQIEPL